MREFSCLGVKYMEMFSGHGCALISRFSMWPLKAIYAGLQSGQGGA